MKLRESRKKIGEELFVINLKRTIDILCLYDLGQCKKSKILCELKHMGVESEYIYTWTGRDLINVLREYSES